MKKLIGILFLSSDMAPLFAQWLEIEGLRTKTYPTSFHLLNEEDESPQILIMDAAMAERKLPGSSTFGDVAVEKFRMENIFIIVGSIDARAERLQKKGFLVLKTPGSGAGWNPLIMALKEISD